ncbi:MAG: flagellar export chaperone FliS [Betaproteobacteria bacterium]|nr:flagellar export chaperone FliS [Betaproteobacteria bacterium]NDE52981.1 flagellar export chaperone FliS [Actinomycetota bacterium]
MRAARAYRSVDQSTAVISGSPVDLTILLYERLIERLLTIKLAVECGDIAARGEAVGFAIELIEKGLVGALDLDQGGEVALQLQLQYKIWVRGLLRVTMSGDPDLIQALEAQFRTVLEAWKEIRESSRR